MKSLLVFALVTTIVAGTAQGAESVFSGRVVSNNDGDTLVIESGDKHVRVRLWGVDAPESRQESGPEARDFTRAFTANKAATAHVRANDAYGRVVCEVFVDGKSLNRELARAGHGWWYQNYARGDHDLRDLVAAAQSARRGLWANSDPVPPWEWRRQNPVRFRSGTTDAEVGADTQIAGSESPLEMRTRSTPAIPAEMRGPQLLLELRRLHAPTSTLSYGAARRAMFTSIDSSEGSVRCVYTGEKRTVRGIPSPTFMNTEHTWPQSRFQSSSRRGDIKCDVHHLFTTLSRVNQERGNKPLHEIQDEDADTWWNSSRPQAEVPSVRIDDYSESDAFSFEPREDHKGNAARALLYVAVIYGDTDLPLDWIDLNVLGEWHARDPVDEAEAARNAAIERTQGNRNPFVDDAALFARAADALSGR